MLDASAILEGFEPLPPSEFAVPPAVADEVSRGRAGRRMGLLVEAGLLVQEPTGEARGRVAEAAASLGESRRLSAADVDVLALAIDLGLPCVSDDYSVQNVARRLGVEVVRFHQRGISEVWAWELRCPGCGRTFGPDQGEECPVCGTTLRSRRAR